MPYYRALATPGHVAHFNRSERNSYHASTPGEWIQTWQHTRSVDRQDYPLCAFGGPYTAEAREAFLHSVQTIESDIWPEAARLASSQLDGLCAYRTAPEALKYGVESVLGEFGQELYLVLEGNETGVCAEPGSVLVRLERVVDGPLRREVFLGKYVDSPRVGD